MNLFARAKILGNTANPNLFGIADFYEDPRNNGVWVEIEVTGLPDTNSLIDSNFYGMHIHEIGDCTVPFDKTGEHYNPKNISHPNHAGDLPPLLGTAGYAFALFYTGRFGSAEIINKSIIIHNSPDDFRTQPSGNSGNKIACGVIRKC